MLKSDNSTSRGSSVKKLLQKTMIFLHDWRNNEALVHCNSISHTIHLLSIDLKDPFLSVCNLLDSWLSIFYKAMTFKSTKKEGNYPFFCAVYRILQEWNTKVASFYRIKKSSEYSKDLNQLIVEEVILWWTSGKEVLLTKNHFFKSLKREIKVGFILSDSNTTNVEGSFRIKKRENPLFWVRKSVF